MAYPQVTSEPGAIDLARQIAQGALSPLEAVDAAISRIEQADPAINSVVVHDFDRARDTARLAGERGAQGDQPLFGVPMTVKESFDVAGLPSTWGHTHHAQNIASEDAEMVRCLRRAGAIILGKSNVPVDLSDWQSFNPVYGRTGNPHDTSRSAGGSSGGGAATVAAGLVPCEYGSDIGGSIRVPAHFCGVWGHKPSWGLVSKQGHDHPARAGSVAHDGALSVAGPLARNAADLALLLERTASLPIRRNQRALRDMRFLLIIDHPDCPVDASVRAPIEAAVDALEAAGATVERRPRGFFPDLARQQADYIKMLNVAMARGLPAPDGTRASATDWFNLLDRQALSKAEWAELFTDYDFVLAPPAPILAFPHRESAVFNGEIEIDGKMRRAADGLAWAGIATMPELPSTVLPVGGSGNLPCGMQVIGPRWSDFDCIEVAGAIGDVLHG